MSLGVYLTDQYLGVRGWIMLLTSDVSEPICQFECDSGISGILELVAAKVWHPIKFLQNNPQSIITSRCLRHQNQDVAIKRKLDHTR